MLDIIFNEKQIIGYIAFCVTTYAFSHTSDRRMLWLHFMGSCLWCAHSVVLDAWVGSLTNLVLAARILCAVTLHHWTGPRKRYISFGFIIGNILLAALAWQHWFDILPLAATILGTINTMHWNGLKMRYAMLASNTMWLLYSLFIHSIGGVMSGIVLSIMICSTIWRLHKKYKTEII